MLKFNAIGLFLTQNWTIQLKKTHIVLPKNQCFSRYCNLSWSEKMLHPLLLVSFLNCQILKTETLTFPIFYMRTPKRGGAIQLLNFRIIHLWIDYSQTRVSYSCNNLKSKKKKKSACVETNLSTVFYLRCCQTFFDRVNVYINYRRTKYD